MKITSESSKEEQMRETVGAAPPPVSSTQLQSSLRSHLRLDDLPLAATDRGREFCLKALHPAENSIKGVRVPSLGNRPTAVAQVDSVFTVSIPHGSATLWCTADPLLPLVVQVPTTDTTQSTYQWYSTLLPGGGLHTNTDMLSHNDLALALAGLTQSYRVNALSFTVNLIAPDLANQGRVVAAQFTSQPQTMMLETDEPASRNSLAWMRRSPPTVSSVVQGTTAYTGQARDGVYMPMKIEDVGKWHSTADLRGTYEDAIGSMPVAYPGVLAPASGNAGFPTYVFNAGVATPSTFHPQGWNAGVVWFEGLSTTPAVSIQVRVRQVVEMVPWPSTSYSSMVEPPPPYDELAIKMYYEVSSRMKDAYPASYNDLSKLRAMIAGLAKRVMPYVDPALSLLSSVPGTVGRVAGGVKMVKDSFAKPASDALKKKKVK